MKERLRWSCRNDSEERWKEGKEGRKGCSRSEKRRETMRRLKTKPNLISQDCIHVYNNCICIRSGYVFYILGMAGYNKKGGGQCRWEQRR